MEELGKNKEDDQNILYENTSIKNFLHILYPEHHNIIETRRNFFILNTDFKINEIKVKIRRGK